MLLPDLYGVDVSYANGNVDWARIKATNWGDFAIIRAGHGTEVDEQFVNNVLGCSAQGIPFGLYWFGECLNDNMAANEGNYAVDALLSTGAQISYPIWFDWEDYSETNFRNHTGRDATDAERKSFALSFVGAVQARGYTAGLYTNPSYLEQPPLGHGMQDLIDNGMLLWIAFYPWYPNTPPFPPTQDPDPRHHASMWQYGQDKIGGNPSFPTMDFDLIKIGENYTPMPGPGPGPGPHPTSRKGMPIWMMTRRRPRGYIEYYF